DAFPFHLRTKAQNASGFHDPANLEATAYAKWAEDGLYFAVAVRDNVHKQSENAVNMWKNDSVQVTLDPLGNREAPYGVDDVEWGFALADDGRLLTNIFNSTPPNPSGEVSGQTPFKAVRDEAAGRTLYEFKIPAAHVKDLNPKLGGSIGFNIAINDADFQNGRDNFIQWTNGTADAKNTSFYDSFAFIDDDSQIPVAGVSLDSTELALKPGEEFPLSVILEPMDAANQAVTWNSDNAAVAAVDAAGKVTAAGPGTAVITVTTADGG
ncbi:Ig-like domain-containing protein, partial [Paenibacillus sepulcri]|nr:Ig-like domain-containing protein [Paenibacillus sepulcri]